MGAAVEIGQRVAKGALLPAVLAEPIVLRPEDVEIAERPPGPAKPDATNEVADSIVTGARPTFTSRAVERSAPPPSSTR